MNLSIRRRGFSLIELVIVIVIIGIIGAIAVPRMSRAATGAADSSLVADLNVLRTAIDLYQAEHGGTYPTFADFVAQLTTYTDAAGNDNASKTTTYIYGPYIREIPSIKLGPAKGLNTVSNTAEDGSAWYYNETTGEIRANYAATVVDASGTPYVNY
ncbi:MAG: type II secretion system protein [Phycisphaerales bacterium JB065]